MLKNFAAAAAVALSASLLLAGCGGGATTADAEPATGDAIAPATGDTIDGDGYSYSLPDGWGVPDVEVPGFQPDTFAADLEDTDGFADNVNVLLSPAGEVSSAEVGQAGVAELESAGYQDVTITTPATVDGVEAVHVEAGITENSTEVVMDQFYANNDAQTYIITFTFNATVTSADRATVYESVLASWSWE